ncbi:MAG: Zn-ribbon domain-containing OB-fold protein [Anaerolineaceae bacterium]|nr:Zn-ribbon domain-containing OB-fold protein [Anaerolineaceae bacterium]
MADNLFTGTAFNQWLNDGKLMGSACKHCGALHLPPRPICTVCQSGEMEWRELSGHGRLTAYSVIFIAPTAMLNEGYSRTNPYCTGIVKLDEGPSISAQIIGVDVTKPETIAVGTPLSVAYLHHGDEAVPQTRLAFKAGEA